MFEVKKPEMVNRTFRMPKDLVEQLGEVAQQKDVSINRLVIQCCEYALKNLPDDNNEKTE
jgi:predicted HicB family RNase H-like nuclease